MSRLLWRIYYADGTTFSSEDGNAEDAPYDGILAIMRRNGITGRAVVPFDAFYTYHEGCWLSHDLPGVVMQMKTRGLLKEGFYVTNEKWEQNKERWENDPDFPKRSAYFPKDRR